ncbi:MAG: ABC transporter permease subunit [Akkermansiaceae bacterium]|nr:ABC transporter permease subunit [Akkermansiaceae bacterium]
MSRKLGILLLILGLAAMVAHWLGLSLPTLRWYFGFDAEDAALKEASWWTQNRGEILGHLLAVLTMAIGVLMILRPMQATPHTQRQLKRFKSMGRGWISFLIILFLVALALLDQALVGKRALAVKYEGKWYFPAFKEAQFSAETFGGSGKGEANYRKLKERFEQSGEGLVIMPPVPYDPTYDSDNELRQPLELRKGIYYEEGSNKPYSGLGYRFYPDEPTRRFSMQKFRKGVQQGREELYRRDGDLAVVYDWKDGVRLPQPSMGEEYVEEFSKIEAGKLYAVTYAPLPPSWESRHFLGTDSRGWDVLAQLYGGLQVVMQAAVIYLLVTYSVGLTLGCIMGYFGGMVDITLQRLIEILANVPFLYVVIIIADRIGRDNITLLTILLVICIFSWISSTYYMRTATYREKAKDYVAAARLLGATPTRVIFRHVLPNVISIVVTLLPFSVAAIITSLTALDFIGFGLPEQYPSWGRLLSDGVTHVDTPWIVSSAFAGMVAVLLLVTFVGEAVREAFDPKKFTVYR